MEYGDPNSVFCEFKNTDTNGLGKASIILTGVNAAGAIVADLNLDIRTPQSIFLTPGYPLTSPALQAHSTGNVDVLGGLTSASQQLLCR